ncbi:MAG: hypothetical protein ACRD4Y_11425 [Candidatus Acidiferrales bacterium]
MGFDKKEMIEQLKFEIMMIERGGYDASVREPRHNSEIFRDSITCLNVGHEEKVQPCSNCFLSEFVPPELRGSSGDLCHKIPLNERGETVESLNAEDNPQKLQDAVLAWLRRTVAKLEEAPAKQ